MRYHTLKICGLTRKLPLIAVGRRTEIASLSILGDVELVDCLANVFAEKLREIDFDFLVGPEVKVVPLVHGVALRLGHKRFVVCRKSIKPYMVSPVLLKPLSHFPKHVKELVLDGEDAQRLKNKRVVIFDDVISTGVTMRMMDKLMEKVGARVVKRAAILLQGKQYDQIKDLIYLSKLPVFKK